jgi:hypothetical protein
MNPNPMEPSPAMLVKLGSLIVHYEEFTAPNSGHEFDKLAIDAIRQQPDVREWFTQMDNMGMLPKKRQEQP